MSSSGQVCYRNDIQKNKTFYSFKSLQPKKVLLKAIFTKKSLIWIGLGLFALVLRLLLGQYPMLIEQYYSRGLFTLIRVSIDFLAAWFPVALIYVFFSFLLVILISRAVKFWRWDAKWQVKLGRAVVSVVAFWMAVVFFFLFLWGFNYARVDLENTIGLEPNPLSKEQLWEELQHHTDQIIKLRSEISNINDSIVLAKAKMPDKLEQELRASLEQQLAQWGYPTNGRVRARLLYPKGIFLRFSSSGLYFPLTGEGHVDAGLHYLQWPYVMTHEMGHGYGFGDEGSCNFLGYVGCINSDNTFVKYAGHLAIWRTLAINYQRYDRERYWAFRESLPQGIQADLDAINENLFQYPDIMPRARYVAYNTYLKAQGIEEGMKNYSRVIMLARAWRLKN